MIQKQKVLSIEKMVEIEKSALADGCNELEFMEFAGVSVADFVERFLAQKKGSQRVTLLPGKGNNAGDAYVCGIHLLNRGVFVQALSFYSPNECSPLCLKQLNRFLEAGGKICSRTDVFEGVLIDGLVGTGFKGKAEGVLAEAISWANSTKLPIIAVDIPSGVCGDTGQVGTVAIFASSTVYLEFPKIGFFLADGWNHTGELVEGKFGLPSKYYENIEPVAFLVQKGGMQTILPISFRTQNKYKVGYLLAIAGSKAMMGAGALVSQAALRSGAGIVRWFYPEGCEQSSVLAGLDVIKDSSVDSLFNEMKRASALVIGPGMGREDGSFRLIEKVLSACVVPAVIDADALFFLSERPFFTLPRNALLTPHLGELQRLLKTDSNEGSFLEQCQNYVQEKKVFMLVKGAPNFLFQEGELPYILPFGNPGMAKAGTGDVLSGILGGLLAHKLPMLEVAVLGCFLHGLAGDLVVEDKTVFCLTASDLLLYIPKAFKQIVDSLE